jgi:hypothetical protein
MLNILDAIRDPKLYGRGSKVKAFTATPLPGSDEKESHHGE